MSLSVSIIVTAHNEIEYTRACLEHLRKFSSACELVVVDNGSTDGTAELLRSQQGIAVIRNEENRGFARASNQGAARASGEVLVFLHNDVLVSKGWLERLVRPLEGDPGAGLVGPHTNEASGVQKISAPFNNIKALQRFAFDFARQNDGRVFEVGRLSSFCLAVRRETWERLGPFDEAFGSTWLDDDYSVRVTREGLKLLCAGDVFVYHFGGQTFRGNGLDKDAEFLRDRNTYLGKWSRKRTAALIAGSGRCALQDLAGIADGAVVIAPEPPPGAPIPVRAVPPVEGEEEAETWSRLMAEAARFEPEWVLLLKEGEVPEAGLAQHIHNLTNSDNISTPGYTFEERVMAHRNFFYAAPALRRRSVPVLFRGGGELTFGRGAGRVPSGVEEKSLVPCPVRLKNMARLAGDAGVPPGPVGAREELPPVRPWEEKRPTRRTPEERSRILNLLPADGRSFLFLTDAPEWWAFLLKSWGREEVCAVVPPGLCEGADAPSVDALVVGDAETVELPFAEGRFDVIVFDSVLNRAASPQRLLARYRPYLEASGVLIANVFNHGNMECAAGLMLDDWRYTEGGLPDFDHLRLFTLPGVKELMAGAELPIVFLEGRTAALRTRARRALDALRSAGIAVSEEESIVTQYIVAGCRDREACTFTGVEKLPTLSVCLIAKNEEAVLARCLESVRGVADEIVLVDTGSTDRTVEIAQRYGARVSFFEWTKDFSEARNVSLRKATGDWILVLDADEVLDPGSAMLLKRILKIGEKPGVMRMYFLREISYYNADSQTEQAAEHKNLRLFPNSPDICFRGKIHEQVHYEGALPFERLTTPLIIHHYGYMNAELDRKDRNERNIELLKAAIEEAPDEPFHRYNMGCQLYFAGEHAGALAYFDEVIERIPLGASSGYLPMSYVLAAVCLDQTGQPGRAVERLETILESVPALADAHYHLGRILTNLDRFEEAERHLHLAIHAETEFSDYLGNFDVSTTTWKPLIALGILRTRQGRWEEALDSFFKASTFKPDEEGIWAYVGKCNLQLGRNDKAHGYYSKVHAMSPSRTDFYPEWAQVLINLGKPGEAISVMETYLSSRESPDLELGLVRLYVQEGRGQSALARLAGFIERYPSNSEALMTRGALLLTRGDLEGARRDLERCIELSPTSPGARNNLGALESRLGSHESARRHYLEAARLGTGRAEALQNLLEADLALGGAAKVEEDLPFIVERLGRCAPGDAAPVREKIALLFPDRPRGEARSDRLARAKEMERLGDAHRDDRDGYAKALEYLNTSIKLDPENKAALLKRGKLLEFLGRWEEAHDHHRRAWEIDPTFTEAWESVIGTLYARGRQAEAVDFARRCLERLDATPSLTCSRAILEGWIEQAGGAPPLPEAGAPVRASIVILCCNQLRYTRLCLDSLYRFTEGPFEVILVDNGSTDGTAEYLGTVPDAVVIRNEENRGFAAGNNQGIRAARGEYVVLLNNDTILTEGWLDRLVACARSDPRAGIVGPKTNYAGENVQKVIDKYELSRLQEFAAHIAREHGGHYIETHTLFGFCWLIPRAVVRRVGLLDERFGLGGYEDNDYSHRVQVAGYRLYCAGDTFIHHFGSLTYEALGLDPFAVQAENLAVFRKKWRMEQ